MEKNLVILVGKDGRPSMRSVYSQMKSGILNVIRRPKKGKAYIRYYTTNNGETYTKKPFGNLVHNSVKLIRWGNRIPTETNGETITYNKSEAIKLATDKKRSRELFMEKDVRTSKLVTPTNVVEQQYPIIARPFTHSKGKNFIVLKTPEEFTSHFNANNTNGWYYSEFIDKQREFRVHCAHGKVLDLMEKPRVENSIAWNRAINHEAFVRVKQSEYIHDVCLQALKATQVLQLDFAGVDVLLKDDLAYVLEVNTSPTLNSSDHVSSRYAKYFDWLNNSDTRRSHYNFTEFKKPTSFAWKNEQLAS